MAVDGIPLSTDLIAIAGLGVTLAGFSGLVAAFRRSGQWKPLDSYRLLQIPEMGLSTALIALATIPLALTVGSGRAAIQWASGLALIFVIGQVVVLITRARAMGIELPRGGTISAGLVDTATFLVGAYSLALGSLPAFEWLLLLLLARTMLAFVLVMADMPSDDG
jgi:hypothetical protein